LTLVPLVARGRPLALGAHISPVVHVSTAAWGLAIAWRLVALLWLAPVLALVVGEALALVAPRVGIPPVTSVVAETIGVPPQPIPPDAGSYLAALGVWGLAAWAALNGVARLVNGLRMLGSPAFTAPAVWTLALSPGAVAAPQPTPNGATAMAAPPPPVSAPDAAGLVARDTPTLAGREQASAFQTTCFGLTLLAPTAGFPPRPVPRDAPGWPAYQRACVTWWTRVHASVAPDHRAGLPSETELRLTAADEGPDEDRLEAALAHADLRPETKRAVYNGANLATIGKREWAYYRPDVVIRVPADLFLVDVELDGSAHVNKEAHDEQRNQWFQARGWYVARLWRDSANPSRWPQFLVGDMREILRWHQMACHAACEADASRA